MTDTNAQQPPAARRRPAPLTHKPTRHLAAMLRRVLPHTDASAGSPSPLDVASFNSSL